MHTVSAEAHHISRRREITCASFLMIREEFDGTDFTRRPQELKDEINMFLRRGAAPLGCLLYSTLTRLNKEGSQRFVTPTYDSHGHLKLD